MPTSALLTDYNVTTTNNQYGWGEEREEADIMYKRKFCQVLSSQDIKLMPNIIQEMEAS
jgi:hypothetical protein